MIQEFQQLKPFFTSSQNVLIVAHSDPDMDAIGSALALSIQLKKQGIQNVVWAPDSLGTEFQFLPEIHTVTQTCPENYSLVIALDSSHKTRIKQFEKINPTVPLINLDHHHDNDKFGSINIVLNISSIGELLLHLFEELKWPLDKETAICLYAAMVFDTGSFRYSSVTSKTMIAAAKCLEFGIQHDKICSAIFENKPPQYLELVKTSIEQLYVSPDLQFAYTSLPNCPKSAGHDIVDFIRQLDSVNVIAVFREMNKREVKVSLRSKNDFDVSRFASYFGGGGHKKAAGIRFEEPLEKVIRKVVSRLEQELERST